MTYFTFLLIFVLIPILGISLVLWFTRKTSGSDHFEFRLVLIGIAVHVFLALTYTTPWDNYLVATGVWSYNPELVTGFVIGFVPIEEYTFFIVETILSGLVWCLLARHLQVQQNAPRDYNKKINIISSLLLGLCWLFFTYQFLYGSEQWNYLGIIFFWALPPIIIQSLFGADLLWHYRKLVFFAIVIPGTYLSLTDIIALRATIWQISPTQTLGENFFGILPLEEVSFFFVTNILITFGMTLVVSKVGQQRLKEFRGFVAKVLGRKTKN